MPTIDLAPITNLTSTGAWGGGGSGAIDDPIDTPDDASYLQGSDGASARRTYSINPLPAVLSIASVTMYSRRKTDTAGNQGQEDRYGIRIGSTDYMTGFAATPTGFTTGSNVWLTSPATGLAWTKTELDTAQIVFEMRDPVAAADGTQWSMLGLRISYIPASLGAAREIGTVALLRRRKPRELGSISVAPWILDNELMDDLSVSHFAHPFSTAVGAGSDTWRRLLVRADSFDIDLATLTVDLGFGRRRNRLVTYFDGAESRRTTSGIEDGVMRLTTGGTLAYSRLSKAWVTDPGSGLVVEIQQNERPIADDGLLLESFSSQLLTRSSFISGTTGLTLTGTGVNGSAIASEASPPEPLFASTVTANALKFTAGNPHAADLVSTWAATGTIAANTVIRPSVDHRDDSGAVLQWQLQRAVDNFYWDDSGAGSWVVGNTYNSFAVRTTRARDKSVNRVDVGGSNTTVTFRLRLASGGTASRVNRVYHVQLEDNGVGHVTSRIVTDTLEYAREVQTYTVTNNTGKRAFNNGYGTFLCEFIPSWDAADMNVSGNFPSFFELGYDANDSFSLFYNGPATNRLDFTVNVGGSAVAATIPFTPVAGTTYKIGCRWLSSAAEFGQPALTISVYVDGVKGTDAVRSGNPTEADSLLYIGTSATAAPCNGNIRRILFTQEVLTDAEIASGRW